MSARNRRRFVVVKNNNKIITTTAVARWQSIRLRCFCFCSSLSNKMKWKKRMMTNPFGAADRSVSDSKRHVTYDDADDTSSVILCYSFAGVQWTRTSKCIKKRTNTCQFCIYTRRANDTMKKMSFLPHFSLCLSCLLSFSFSIDWLSFTLCFDLWHVSQ